MPILSRREVADMCGVSPAYITQYVKRKKIILDKNGNIDDSLPMNKDFIKARIGEVSNEPAPVQKVVKPKPKAKAKPKTKKQKKEAVVDPFDLDDPNDENAQSITKYNLELQKKELEVEKITEEVRKLKLTNAKLVGETIPMDIVLLTFEHHFRSVSSEFYNAADNFIGTITTRLGADKSEVAHIRKDLIDIVNQSIHDAIKQSKKDVKKISKVYSEKRGKGESR